jgi:hypothetical protein
VDKKIHAFITSTSNECDQVSSLSTHFVPRLRAPDKGRMGGKITITIMDLLYLCGSAAERSAPAGNQTQLLCKELALLTEPNLTA